jgi:hypothetical protein
MQHENNVKSEDKWLSDICTLVMWNHNTNITQIWSNLKLSESWKWGQE